MDTYLNGGVKHMKVTNAEPFANCVIRKFKWLSGGVHALVQHASKNIHKQKATFHFASTHTKKDSEQHESQTTEEPSVPSSSGQSEMGSMSSEVSQQGAKQASIKDFFMRTKSGDQPKTTELECKGSESTLTVQDQVIESKDIVGIEDS